MKLFNEYKVQICSNNLTSKFIKSLYYIFNILQIFTTITGHIRIILYSQDKKASLRSFLNFWVCTTFIFSIIANIYLNETYFTVFFNYYRIYEIVLVNLWLFLFRQGATSITRCENEDNIRLLILLIIQYLTIIICFAGLFYYYAENHDVLHFSSNIKSCKSFFSYLYFSLVTITTLGFGDITPIKDLGFLLVSVEIVIGMIFNLLFIAIIISKLRFEWRK